MEKVGSAAVNRRVALFVATLVGVGFGAYNVYWPPVDLTPSAALAVFLVLSVPLTAVVHELTHGLTSRLLGYRPRYGFKPPLVYVTFDEKVTALHYKVIALAPFVAVSAACVALVAWRVVPQLFYFCLMINVMGAVGDLWATARLLFRNRGYWVQDTKSGFDLYRETPSAPAAAGGPPRAG